MQWLPLGLKARIMNSDLPIREQNGMFSVMLSVCSAGILSHILDPAVPVVWIRDHSPNRYLQWWKTQALFSEKGAFHEAEVRWMRFDLQLPTARFLEYLPEFEDHGMLLFQMTRRVPDTLTLDGLDHKAADRVLIQNGLHLRFNLPHANECAQLASPYREVLERALQRSTVGERAY